MEQIVNKKLIAHILFHFRLVLFIRSQENEPGGAAEAFARREEERARERKNHKSKRRKPSASWDIAPRGFEHISPLQYKAMQGIVSSCVLSQLKLFDIMHEV